MYMKNEMNAANRASDPRTYIKLMREKKAITNDSYVNGQCFYF